MKSRSLLYNERCFNDDNGYHNVEFDINPNNSAKHKETIESNDPNSINDFIILSKTKIKMTDNFSFFTFSIFIGTSFSDFSDAVLKSPFYGGLLKKGKAHLKMHDNICISKYFNPDMGAVLAQFSWWASDLYPNIVFLSSNISDGLHTGCYSFHEILKCTCIRCSISTNKDSSPMMFFECIKSNGSKRVIMAIKEDRWTFFQQGEPLSIENTEYYNNSRIKDRINFSIIKEYLLNLGIDFYKIDSSINECTTYIRTEWGS